MQISSTEQNPGSKGPVWHFLAEHTISEYTSEKERGCSLIAVLQEQAVQDLGIPLECLARINEALIEFVNLMMLNCDQTIKGSPIVIRLFMGKMKSKSARSDKTIIITHEKQTVAMAQRTYPPGEKICAGWGFFIVERARVSPVSPDAGSPSLDIYLYQEGE